MTEQNAVLRSRYNNVYVYIGLGLWFCSHLQQKLQSNQAAAFASTLPLTASTAGVCVQMGYRQLACLDIKDIPVCQAFFPMWRKKHCVRKRKQAHLGDCMVPDKETSRALPHLL